MTTSAICTLFEGSYHFGVAALTNSLQAHGFRGDVFAGCRGPLPAWAAQAAPLALPGWPQARAMQAGPGVRLIFLPLETTYHLTNYKPEFMLALLEGPAQAADALFYLDPDICVAHDWRFFDDWVGCGVALCEDVNSPLPENHPRRIGWRRFFGARGLALAFRGAEYVNGGFVGVQRSHIAFLRCWRQAMELMSEETGPLSVGLTTNDRYRSTGFADCFDRTDQDVLNVACEAGVAPVSIIGQEAMGFRPGQALVPHALGGAKPWQRRYLRLSLNGVPPRLADKLFWRHVRAPLAPYGALQRASRSLELLVAAFVGRFVRRT